MESKVNYFISKRSYETKKEGQTVRQPDRAKFLKGDTDIQTIKHKNHLRERGTKQY